LFKIGEKKGTECGKTCHASSDTMCSIHLKAQQKKEETKATEIKTNVIKPAEADTDCLKTDNPVKTDFLKTDNPVKTDFLKTDNPVKTEKKKRVTKKEEEKKNKTLCTFALKSGDNIGKECGRICTDGNIMCAVHIRSTEADKKKNETVKKEKKEPVFCTGMLKNNAACTNKAVEGTTTCKMHKVKKENNETGKDAPENKTLRLKRDGERYLVKGTNVLFDMTRQCIIGYKKDDEYIFEENAETKEICHSYALPFEKK